MVDEKQRNWCEFTPYVTFAYNTSYHSSTTFSPFYLLYVREARIPIDLVPADWSDYVTEMRSQMKQAFQTVRDQLGQVFQRARQTYDGRVKKLHFKWATWCGSSVPEDGFVWDPGGNHQPPDLGRPRRYSTLSTT